MTSSIRIGSIAGVAIRIDYSWFIISVLIAWGFVGLYSDQVPSVSDGTHWLMGILSAVLFFASVLGHELSHSLVAIRKGIGVDSITLFIFGGVARIKKEATSPGDEFQIAIAGPVASIVLGGVLLGVGVLSDQMGVPTAAMIFQTLGILNIFLAVFNLLPGFPLDGGRVLRAIWWKATGDVLKATRAATRAGSLVAALLAAYGVFRIVAGEFFGGIWIILIAMFLYQAAQQSYRQQLIRSTLEGMTARDLMSTEVDTIPGNLTLDQAVDDYFLARRHSAFPVVGYGGDVEGLITLQMVRDVPREQWPETRVRASMIEPQEGLIASPDEPLISLVDRMSENPTGRFLVMTDGELIGILTAADLSRRVKLRTLMDGQDG